VRENWFTGMGCYSSVEEYKKVTVPVFVATWRLDRSSDPKNLSGLVNSLTLSPAPNIKSIEIKL